MKKFFYIVTTLLLAGFFLTSCGGVTETGNPTQPGTFAPNISGDANLYENEQFGIVIVYPDQWIAEELDGAAEAGGGTAVVFESQRNEIDTATVILTRLSPPPDSLFAYLSDTYPDRTFTPYFTTKLSGYFYDDPADGQNGGDLREYFFLSGDVVVHVQTETTTWGKAEIGVLLEGISFEG